jgi:ferrous iron transport protein B
MASVPIEIGIIGNPNSGKTTLFNTLTGSNRRVGNWPGVTVEKKSGIMTTARGAFEQVDLPGIYSLMANSEEERISRDYILSGRARAIINIIDATNPERNLYLTTLLLELGVPIILVFTMTDLAYANGIHVEYPTLAQKLGCPVLGVNATDKHAVRKLADQLGEAIVNALPSALAIPYPEAIDRAIRELAPACTQTASALNLSTRHTAMSLLENDALVLETARRKNECSSGEIERARAMIDGTLHEAADIVLADARYAFIHTLAETCITRFVIARTLTQKLDALVLNRWLGIPIFLLIMYGVFTLTQLVGGAFIDFFDLFTGTLFVDGSAALLEKLSAPAWVIALISSGLGAGIQTLATFIPPIFFMFVCLTILEDSGYMARAAFVMDAFLHTIGLPGKAFVPLLVGFGCSVPAIMGTRTLENKRDRLMTIFMVPFMSCGAKLPVYSVFGAAFFGAKSGLMIFFVYLSGIILAITTGLLLKVTLFKGEPSHFIMELPLYHVPRFRQVMITVGERLGFFIKRAGQAVLPMILILGFLNSVGKDGSIGNEDSKNSLLSVVGASIQPAFEPMGVEKENWPAAVAIFTGLFAKEAVIGTMTSLYAQMDSIEEPNAEASESGFDLIGGIRKACQTIPDNLAGLVDQIFDPLGLKEATASETEIASANTIDISCFQSMRTYFSKGANQAFAFLLFILTYVPCIAAMSVALRELGKGYGLLLMVYLTVLGWSVATLYYQITLGHSGFWIAVSGGLLVAIGVLFTAIGKQRKVQMI